MTDIVTALIAAVAAIIVAYQNARTTKYIKSSEARAARRAHESRLAMELMYATCNLAMTTARNVNCLDDEVQAAIRDAEKSKAAYMSFVRDEAAKNFAKI